MNKNEISQLYRAGNYSAALKAVIERPPSTWRDTAELRCLRALDRSKEALSLANRLYRDELSENDHRLKDPELSHQLRVLAKTFDQFDQPGKAARILAELVKINSDSASLRLEFGTALLHDGQFDQAELILNSVIKARPSDDLTATKLGELLCHTARIEDGISAFYRAASVNRTDLILSSQLCYWESFRSGCTDQTAAQLAHLFALSTAAASKKDPVERSKLEPDKKLKVGFLIKRLAQTRMQACLLPLLEKLDREKFKIIVFNDMRTNEQADSALKHAADVVKNTHVLANDALAEQIREEGIDILIDTIGHGKSSRLAMLANRIAPLQLNWLTFQTSSGLTTLDYTISDAVLHPIEVAEQLNIEKPLHLSQGSMFYSAPQKSPEIVQRGDDSTVILGSFVEISKISDSSLDCWAAAMAKLGDAVLVIKQPKPISKSTQSYLLDAFADRDIEPNRIILDHFEDTLEARLDQYNDIDIALDSSPHNGHLTTLESLWMGVPVVTIAGQTTAGRISASILKQFNIDGFVASSNSEFANIVKQLAEQPELRSQFRRTLRESMVGSLSSQNEQLSKEFGNSIRWAWQTMCTSKAKDSSPALGSVALGN